MGIKVCKFGGTSCAHAQAILQVANIIKSDSDRRFVVVSAPGKRNPSDTKVTDLLLQAYHNHAQGMEANACLASVFARFDALAKDLQVSVDFSLDYAHTVQALQNRDKSFVVSRGEYFCAKILAKLIGFQFVDASKLIRFSSEGELDLDFTEELAKKELKNLQNAVIPGFYGADVSGKVHVFSRGGSDISGAIIAAAVHAEYYENFTDVNGFRVCDPRLVSEPQKIDVLTYKELRELAYMGANVLHPESIFPVRKAEIPINIKNTFDPEDSGTLIVPTRRFRLGEFTRKEDVITGIAGRKCFVLIHIEKSMLNAEIGFARRLLSILENYGVSLEHLPTGIDTISLILDATTFDKSILERILCDIKKATNPDVLEVYEDLALIAIVGHGMEAKSGVAARVFQAISSQNINLKMIDQGSSEINIILGVQSKDFDSAIKSLYKEFY